MYYKLHFVSFACVSDPNSYMKKWNLIDILVRSRVWSPLICVTKYAGGQIYKTEAQARPSQCALILQTS